MTTHMKKPGVFPFNKKTEKRRELMVEALCGEHIPFGEALVLAGDKQWSHITCERCLSPESVELYERAMGLFLLKVTNI